MFCSLLAEHIEARRMHFSCKSLWCDGHFLESTVRGGQMSRKRQKKSEIEKPDFAMTAIGALHLCWFSAVGS